MISGNYSSEERRKKLASVESCDTKGELGVVVISIFVKVLDDEISRPSRPNDDAGRTGTAEFR